MRTPRRAAVALAGLALVAGLAACGSDDDSGATPATTAGDTAAVEAPDTITIGYQKVPNGDLIVKHEGWLEKAFGKDVKIEWQLFDSGGAVNEAVVAGSVDIGLAGSSPVSRGISSGIAYRVPWIFDVIGEAEALAARNGITSVKDLKGKKVATPVASTSHYSLLAALEENGLSASDVTIVDAEPDDILAAWERGDIDAAYVWNPVLAKLLDAGGKTLITSADLAKRGKTTYDLAVVTDAFADKYPDAVQTWVEQEDRAVGLIQSDPDAAAQAVAAELDITPDEAADQLDDLIFLRASDQASAENLGGGLGKALYAAAQFNKEAGAIDSTKDEDAYTSAVDASFAKAAGS